MNLEVVGMPIVREADGLAMSSRNLYLQPNERQAALALHRSLSRAKQLVEAGERRGASLLQAMRSILDAEPLLRIEYIQVCNMGTLKEVDRIEGNVVIALAAYVGKVRLIDNLLLPAPPCRLDM